MNAIPESLPPEDSEREGDAPAAPQDAVAKPPRRDAAEDFTTT